MCLIWQSILNKKSRIKVELTVYAVADLRGTRGTRTPLGVQIVSIPCNFLENFAKLYVGATPTPEGWRPHLGEILDPPLVWNQSNVTATVETYSRTV